jgi:hypothetical protein
MVAAVLAATGLGLAMVSFPAHASERTETVAITQKTWTWSGPAQHPYGTQHPDFQYVSMANSTTLARTFLQLGVLNVAAGEDLTSLVLTYPANTDPANGGVDPASNPNVPPAQQQGNVALLTACAITAPFGTYPPGSPDDGKVKVDCELGSANGRLDTKGAEPVWRFDLTSIATGWLSGRANHGIAIVPSPVAGPDWTIALDGTKAKLEARVSSADAPPPPIVTVTPSTVAGSPLVPSPVPVVPSLDPGIPLTPKSGAFNDTVTAAPAVTVAVPTTVGPGATTKGVQRVVRTSLPVRRVPAPVWVGLLALAAVLGVAGKDLWAWS